MKRRIRSPLICRSPSSSGSPGSRAVYRSHWSLIVGLSLAPADEPAGELSADCSHTAFNEFRFQIAAAEGIDLGAMDGYGGARGWEGIVSPLVSPLDHPDAEGGLLCPAAAPSTPRLPQITGARRVACPAPPDP